MAHNVLIRATASEQLHKSQEKQLALAKQLLHAAAQVCSQTQLHRHTDTDTDTTLPSTLPSTCCSFLCARNEKLQKFEEEKLALTIACLQSSTILAWRLVILTCGTTHIHTYAGQGEKDAGKLETAPRPCPAI